MKYLPMAALVAYVTRLLILGASVGDSFVILSLATMAAFFFFVEKKMQVDKPVNVEFKQDLDKLKGTLDALKLQLSQRR